MSKFNTKLTAFILCIMICVSLASCGADFKYAGSTDDRIIMKVGGFDVTVDEYNYFYLNAKHDLDQGLESYWTEHPGASEKLRETVVEMLRIRYAVDALAKECGIKLTSDDNKQINAEAKQIAEYYGGDDKFMAILAESNMTGDVYYALTAQSMLDTKLRDFYLEEFTGLIKADDATLTEDIQKNFVCAKQVLISNDLNDDILANKATAEKVQKLAAKGEDFDKLIKEYSEDTAQDEVNGRYFTYGMMLEPFEEAAYALEVGGISEVVESVVGYHVIKRLPLDEAYINEYFEELRELYKNRVYNEKLDEVGASLAIEYTEVYDEIAGSN